MAQRYLKHPNGTVYAWTEALAQMPGVTECSALSQSPVDELVAPTVAPTLTVTPIDWNEVEVAIRHAETKAELIEIANEVGLVPEEGKSKSVVRMRKLMLDQLKARGE